MKNLVLVTALALALIQVANCQDKLPTCIAKVLSAIANTKEKDTLNGLFIRAALDNDANIKIASVRNGGGRHDVTWIVGEKHRWHLRANFARSAKFGDGELIDFRVYYRSDGVEEFSEEGMVLHYPYVEKGKVKLKK